MEKVPSKKEPAIKEIVKEPKVKKEIPTRAANDPRYRTDQSPESVDLGGTLGNLSKSNHFASTISLPSTLMSPDS